MSRCGSLRKGSREEGEGRDFDAYIAQVKERKEKRKRREERRLSEKQQAPLHVL